MKKTEKGRAGCGCLFFLLIVCIVIAGVAIHPFSLRVLGGGFRYADKIVPCDAIFVPRFEEDKHGEIYVEAFREYWAGDGKTIWVENDRVLGLTMKEIVEKMAKARGVMESAVKAVGAEGHRAGSAEYVKATLARQGIRKVVLVVPEYASRRFHLLYGSDEDSGKSPLFLVKPVEVSYFRMDRWWKSDLSRSLMGREVYDLALLYLHRFGLAGEEQGKEEPPP
jgi:hypothetical protein